MGASSTKNYDTKDKVINFYNNNWHLILREQLQDYFNFGKTNIYDKFQNKVSYTPLRKYLGSRHGEGIYKEFEDNLMTTYLGSLENYGKAMGSQYPDVKKKAYALFWEHPENMTRAKKISKMQNRKETISNMIIPYDKVKNILKIYFDENSPNWQTLPGYMIPNAGSGLQKTATPKEMNDVILPELEKLLNVMFIEESLSLYDRWNLGIVKTPSNSKMTLKKYSIYEKTEKKFIGTVYVCYDSNIQQSKTVPLRPKSENNHAINLLITRPDFNLPHEMTHAIQYSFNTFWECPKETVEIPAMLVERHFRKKYKCSFDSSFLRKQVAIALADLDSTSPKEFNKLYEKYGKIKNAGHICARLWHFVNCRFKYFSYVLGLIMLEKNKKDLSDMVKNKYFDF